MNEILKGTLEYLNGESYYTAFLLDDGDDTPFKLLTKEETKSLLDYITNLQEENERLKEDMKIKDDIISITYNKDTKEYILDRKNYYKINKRLNERLDYKSRVEKAVEYMKLIEMDKTDKYIPIRDYNEYKKLLNILNGGENND